MKEPFVFKDTLPIDVELLAVKVIVCCEFVRLFALSTCRLQDENDDYVGDRGRGMAHTGKSTVRVGSTRLP
jgi:hypothetical protein